MDIRTLCAALVGAIGLVSLTGCTRTAGQFRAHASFPAARVNEGAGPPPSMVYHQAHTARPVALAAMRDSVAGTMQDTMHDRALTPMPAQDRTLGVLSYNMKRTKRRSTLAAVAHHLAAEFDELPDFILCQEVMFRRGENGESTSSAADLASSLGCHVRGSKRRGDREGLAIISRYPFAFFEARQLAARSLPLVGWPRVSLMAEFMVPGVGRVRVIDVHLSHHTFEHGIRRKQIAETLAWVAQRQGEYPADVTIFGGDLNTRPQWPELAMLTDAPDLSILNYNGEAPTKGGQGSWRHRIDYIFIAAPGHDVGFLGETLLWEDGLPRQSGRGRFWPSDHLMVHHEYSIMPRNQFAGVSDGAE